MQNDSCIEAAIVLMQEDLLALRHHRGMLHPRRRVGTHVREEGDKGPYSIPWSPRWCRHF
ncbi:hypothetical protein BCR42DRAFT_429429 [Absidia repens]|uniref:Uncharacterized protein n=1 Tax=Absidia repens TaxID=90262 RepID=A0A1X2HWR2_9FUNG|nr:hypothetical protein BCR42DRAFT_429429 [Absidia repens]